MSARVLHEIIARIDEVLGLYHRLLLILSGTEPTNTTSQIQELSIATGAPIINVNFEFSRRLLELTERERALRAQELMKQIIADVSGEIVILNNIELLYEPQLKLNPLKLLQELSRNRTIVAVWRGSVKGSHLSYAEPGHPEYRQYPIHDLQIIDLDQSS